MRKPFLPAGKNREKIFMGSAGRNEEAPACIARKDVRNVRGFHKKFIAEQGVAEWGTENRA